MDVAELGRARAARTDIRAGERRIAGYVSEQLLELGDGVRSPSDSYRDQLGSVIFPRPSTILFFRLLTVSSM